MPGRLRLGTIALALALVVALLGAGQALADTTHPFLENITVAGAGVQPEAIDENGDIIAWLQGEKAVAKYDQNGNPVNFSGLGTNIIDGKGGLECPTVPSDCDRVSPAGFLPDTGEPGNGRTVAVDNSGGPANGYIYVASNSESTRCEGCNPQGEVDVFSSAGIFLGRVDQSQTFPDVYGNESSTIWVDNTGALYIDHWSVDDSHVDRYVPVDGNPAHDQFSGQLRVEVEHGVFEGVAAGPEYAYTLGRDAQHERNPLEPQPDVAKYQQAEFHRQGFYNFSVSETFFPDIGPFGGRLSIGEPHLIYVDPADEHVYLGIVDGGFKEFNPQNQQIGPVFGSEGCPFEPECRLGPVEGMAVDRSGDAHDGRIFVRGNGSHLIAVFGPPTAIPNIEDIEASTGHTTAHLSATIGLAGGPPASQCKLEYGTEVNILTGYESSVPCSPGGSYSTDTEVSVDLGGLAVGGTYHYRFVVKNANGTNTSKDHEFQTQAVLGVSTGPVTNLSPTGAELNGSLDADGMPTSYRFEYGISSGYGAKTSLASAGSGASAEPVAPVVISGLQPGATYHYRIVARNSLGRTNGADRTFVAPRSPRVSGVHASGVSSTDADLNARIDSLSYATTFHFEYGPSTAYGASTPDEPLPAGSEPQSVSAHISGLAPGLSYHYRVVATNEWGTTRTADSSFSFEAPQCPNSHVRQQTSGSFLPDCRAYELVSPANAGAVSFYPGEVPYGKGRGTALPFGELLGFGAPDPSGGATNPARFAFIGTQGAVLGLHPTNFLFDRYVATRTSRGWVTTYPGTTGSEALFAMFPSCNVAMDRCIDYPPKPGSSFGSFIEVKSNAPYVWSVSGRSLGRWPTNLAAVNGGEGFIGDKRPSPDFSHFVFSSRNVAFAPGGLETAPGSAYDNDISEGTVDLVSKLANGDPIPEDGGLPGEFIKILKVSTDGSHILMSTVGQRGLEHLYMRVNDSITYEIGEGTFVGMTSDGTKVAFTTPLRLDPRDTDNSVDMYMWEEGTGKPAVVSLGNGNGNSDECSTSFTEGCGVQAVATERPELDNTMAAKNGAVYFYSPEQLDPSDPGVKNEKNLYLYRNGRVEYVTTMDPGTEVDRMQVSPEGDHMAFLSRTRATGYVNVSLDNGAPADPGTPQAWEEMYTFDPATGEVLCASCIPSGQPPTIASPELDIEKAGTSNKDVKASESGPFMANDGRVAFTTADALVPADTNEKLDVYEFVGNRPQLITTGTSERDGQGGNVFYPGVHTGLESFGGNGTDLYFSTFETLVPQDENGSFVKFYDARTDGGFPVPSALLPCTAADECHGDGSQPPGTPSLATGADLGAGGNAPLALKHRGRHGKQHRKRRRHRHSRSVRRRGNVNG